LVYSSIPAVADNYEEIFVSAHILNPEVRKSAA
jgi:hypothetical protein